MRLIFVVIVGGWHKLRGHGIQAVPDLLGGPRHHFYCDCGKEWVA